MQTKVNFCVKSVPVQVRHARLPAQNNMVATTGALNKILNLSHSSARELKQAEKKPVPKQKLRVQRTNMKRQISDFKCFFTPRSHSVPAQKPANV